MKIEVRPARFAELPALAAALDAEDAERVDLERAVVHVAEADGEVVGFIAARLVWQTEPLWLKPGLGPAAARRRATLGLAKANDDYLQRQRHMGLADYFCFIRDSNPVFQMLARRFGLRRVYAGGQFYRRDWRDDERLT